MTFLVRSDHSSEDDIDALRAKAAELERRMLDCAAELTRAQASLETFRIRYRQEVGTLHEELEALEQAIAEAELGEISRLLGEDAAGSADTPSAPQTGAPQRLTSDAVRRLFREVAKMIHPDLAGDDHTRDRRHALMVEANRAYELGDEDRLRSILSAWENSPEAVEGTDHESTRVRLVRRIAQMEHQLDACARELAAMSASPLGQLKTMVDEAAKRGKDLVADMVRRLRRDIIAARNRLDAMRWNP